MSKKLDIDTNIFVAVENGSRGFYVKLKGATEVDDWIYKIWDDHKNYIVKDKDENIIGKYETFPDLMRDLNKLYAEAQKKKR